MGFVTDNQLLLLILCFLAGAMVALTLFRQPAGHGMWRVADLIWVLVGGIGALVAVIAGFYTEDTSRLDRKIDLAFAATSVFDRDAARFRLRFCEAPDNQDALILCEKVEFLSASTAKNADLPLFLSLSQEAAPLQGLRLWGQGRGETQKMTEMVRNFDPSPFLVFSTLDEASEGAVDRLRATRPEIAGDFLILARSYEDLIERVGSLRSEWEYLQANAGILILQICALCLLSFAAPFRFGKSVADLLNWMRAQR